MPKAFYAVRRGRQTGLFRSWDAAHPLVSGYAGAEYKGFMTEADAYAWLRGAPAAVVLKKKRHATHRPRAAVPAPVAGEIVVHCDGSAPDNGASTARAGIGCYFGPSDPRNISERLDPAVYRQTNQGPCN